MSEFTAILLTGGSARRLSGIDKATLRIAGESCFVRVLSALQSASAIIVVGPPIEVKDERITFLQEEPKGGGPVAALAAALGHISTERVAVVSVDVPLVSGAVDELRAQWQPTDVALVASDGMHESYLVSIFNVEALRAAIAALATAANASMKSVLAYLNYRPVIVSNPDMLIDVDTPEDLARVEEILRLRSSGSDQESR